MHHAFARLAVLALSSLAAAVSLADDEPPPATGEVLVLPGPLQALVSAGAPEAEVDKPGSPAGWHLPGHAFKAGGDWFALVCEKTCALHATKLDVKPATHHVYDGDPVASQLLHWSPLPGGLDGLPAPDAAQPTLIALLHPGAKLKLTNGPVRTWLHRGMASYPGDGGGEKAARIPIGSNDTVLVVPRVVAPDPNADTDYPPVTLELRTGDRRQKLGEYSFDILGPVPLKGPDYLLWAGDLDGDGKPDLITRLGNDRQQVVLYLSTFAKPGELVGEAGRFDYVDPASAGC